MKYNPLAIPVIVGAIAILGLTSFWLSARAAPQYIIQPTILPQTNEANELGTSTRQWLRTFTESLCLDGDCRNVWPSSSGTSLSTSSPWSGSGLAYRVSESAVSSVATTSLTINAPLTTSGTAGALVGGTNLTIDIDDIKAADLDLTDITLNDFTNDAGFITSAGTNPIATSSAETSSYVPYWTSTAATPATLSGGESTFTYDSTLNKLTATNASTTNLSITNLTSALVQTDSAGLTGEYAGSSNPCTNQLPTTLTALGILGGCTSINNDYWSGTDLSVANGGTGLSTFGGSNTILYTTAADTLASEAAFTYTATSDLLTVVNATTTALTSSYFNNTGNAGLASTTPGFRLSVNDNGSEFYIDSTGKVVGRDTTNAWTGRFSPTRSFSLQTGTTTTWTASTTGTAYSPYVIAPFAGTLRQVRCATDASFVGVNVQVNGSNATPSYFVASTTVGKVGFTAGNTFSAGQKILANFGTTTTADTKSVSCTFDVTETP